MSACALCSDPAIWWGASAAYVCHDRGCAVRVQRERAEAMRSAALQFMQADEARELANNVAMWPREDATAANIEEAIRYRQRNGWLRCSDVATCATAMARAAGVQR